MQTQKRIADITVRELKEIIKESIMELFDPDAGLQLSDEVRKNLHKSLKEKKLKQFISLRNFKRKYKVK